MSAKIFDAAGATTVVPMARDQASGFANDVWSAFVPGVAEGTHHRYVVGFGGGSADRVDPYARSMVFPNFTAASQDDSDASSVVTDRSFAFRPFAAPGWRELVIYQIHIGTFFDSSVGCRPSTR
jgi:1,4-alpha-glucan branching enzyme